MAVVGSMPRDVMGLALPLAGRVDRDERGVWQVVDADGEPVTAVAWFLEELRASDCSEATCRSYAHDLLRWMRFLAAVEVPWERATGQEVRDLVRWLRAAPNRQRSRRSGGRPAPGTLNTLTGKAYLAPGYAPRTINHALSVLSAFYGFAVEAGLGPLVNPVPVARRSGPVTPTAMYSETRAAAGSAGSVAARGTGGRARLRQKQPQHQPRGLGEELLHALFGQLTSERDTALVAVALSSGVRAGELLSMTCGGLDAGRGVIRVVPKGGATSVWVPAAPEAFAQVSRYMLTRAAGGADDPLWLTLRRPDRPLTYFALRQVLERVNAALGTNVSWHDLRHTFSQRLLADDAVGLSDVQQLMRHRSLTSLSVYAATRVEDLVDRLAAHHARPKPPPVNAPGYDPADLQALFPGLRMGSSSTAGPR